MRECELRLRSVRWAQLKLIRQHIEKLGLLVEELPPVDEAMYMDWKEMGVCYLELRKRVSIMEKALKEFHYNMCGRFAGELARCKEDR
jgi:hypothetical protein